MSSALPDPTRAVATIASALRTRTDGSPFIRVRALRRSRQRSPRPTSRVPPINLVEPALETRTLRWDLRLLQGSSGALEWWGAPNRRPSRVRGQRRSGRELGGEPLGVAGRPHAEKEAVRLLELRPAASGIA